jgi:hypothetical protein
MFSAYTIKKVLPRLIISVIAVNVSWYVAIGLLDVANTLGGATREILLAPFSGLETDIIGTLSGGQQGVVSLLLGGGVGVMVLFSSFAVFTPILVGGLLALFIGYVVLVLRQALIIMLIILSPLMLVAWVIPGMENFAKKGVGLYIKLLAMYPIIIALLVSGRIVSAVLNNTGGEGTLDPSDADLLPKILAMVALFAPYFMIPFVLKFMGGFLANISNMANDRSRGMIDGLRKRGHEKSAENRAKTLTGSRFNDSGFVSRKANNFGSRLGAGTKGRFGFGKRGAERLEQNLRLASGEAAQTKGFAAIKDDDGYALQAATYRNAAEAKAGLVRDWGASKEAAERSVAAVQANLGFSRRNAIAAAQQLVNTGTGYNSVERKEDSEGNVITEGATAQQMLAKTIARVSGGNESTISALAGYSNATTKKVGRGDLAPGFGTLADLARRESGMTTGMDGKAFSASNESAYNDAAISAARGQDTMTLLRDKTPGFKNTAAAMSQSLSHHISQATNANISREDRAASFEEAKRISGQIEQFDQYRDYASDNNQQAVHTLVGETANSRQQLDQLIAAQPNAAEHQADMARYKGARSNDPSDPRQLGQRQPDPED